jgi:hypothetical protein
MFVKKRAQPKISLLRTEQYMLLGENFSSSKNNSKQETPMLAPYGLASIYLLLMS